MNFTMQCLSFFIWGLSHSVTFFMFIHVKNDKICWAVVMHAFNPSTWEAEAGKSL